MKHSIWTSRKFLLALSAMLASLGTGITGIIAGNQTLAIIGSVLVVISSSIYAFCEAWTDVTDIKSKNEDA